MSTPIVRRRKRPVPVDTIQWLGDNEADVQAFTGADNFWALDPEDRENSDDPEATATVYDRLHSTWVLVYIGQHIVRGVKGEFYPIAEDVLAETYEAADIPLHQTTDARAAIHAMFPLDETAEAELDRRLDAHRVENRNEAADWLAAYPLGADTTDWARGRGDNLAWVIGILRNPDPQRGDGQAEFFQIGRTYLYTRLRWKFRCDAVTTHPDTGKRVAVGYSHFGHGKWQPGDLSEGIWADGGWTDVTEAGGSRG